MLLLVGFSEKCNFLSISFCFFYCLDGLTIYQRLRLDVTWSGISYTQRSANNFTLFVFLNYQTDCQINLKDLLDKFEIYRKSPEVQHLSPSLVLIDS